MERLVEGPLVAELCLMTTANWAIRLECAQSGSRSFEVADVQERQKSAARFCGSAELIC